MPSAEPTLHSSAYFRVPWSIECQCPNLPCHHYSLSYRIEIDSSSLSSKNAFTFHDSRTHWSLRLFSWVGPALSLAGSLSTVFLLAFVVWAAAAGPGSPSSFSRWFARWDLAFSIRTTCLWGISAFFSLSALASARLSRPLWRIFCLHRLRFRWSALTLP